MALPRVGTAAGPRSPKRPRRHQVLTRDLCPGMLPAVSAVCRWHSGSLPEQGWRLCSLSYHGHPNPRRPSPAGSSPAPAVPRCCRRALCPKIAVPRDGMSPHLHPKVRLSPRTEHPEPSTPRSLPQAVPRGRSRGVTVSLSGRQPIPLCSGYDTPTHNPSIAVSLTPTAPPVRARRGPVPRAHLLGGERHADAVLLDEHGGTGRVTRARRAARGSGGGVGAGGDRKSVV